ncbi:O-antigen ligase family protein [Microbacterium gubbeenense]|uniref:O-antigen ligase family protein n=1 Tax=Microbacterium gubbeenense TaxID=159896 RepID=UPI003F97B014
MLLFADYVALLAGRFTLDRISSSLPAFDLRFMFAYALVLLFMLWLTGIPTRTRRSIAAPPLLAALGWVCWMALSAAWSPTNARVEDALVDLGLLAIFLGIAVAILVRLPSVVASSVWTWVFWTGCIYFLGAVLEGPGAQGRYSAFGGGPNVFVRIMFLGAIAAIFLSSTRRKAAYLAIIPAFAVGAALSGSRGGLLAAAVLVVLFAIPLARILGSRRTLGLIVLTVVAGVIASVASRGAIASFVYDRFVQQTLIEGYSSGRSEISAQVLSLWEGNPVLGVGLDGYYALQPEQGGYEYPHNLLLASAAEGGTIGAILLATAVAVFAFSAWRGSKRHPGALTALVAGVFLFVASMFSGDYYDSRLMWFFLILAVAQGHKHTAAFRPKVRPADEQ